MEKTATYSIGNDRMRDVRMQGFSLLELAIVLHLVRSGALAIQRAKKD